MTEENNELAVRREKLKSLRDNGLAFPNDFKRNVVAGEVHAKYETCDAETLESQANRVSIAGRIMTRRLMGKASFAHIKDMAVEEYEDGFLLSEVPMGEGMLDLKEMARLLRQKDPNMIFDLEMIISRFLRTDIFAIERTTSRRGLFSSNCRNLLNTLNMTCCAITISAKASISNCVFRNSSPDNQFLRLRLVSPASYKHAFQRRC